MSPKTNNEPIIYDADSAADIQVDLQSHINAAFSRLPFVATDDGVVLKPSVDEDAVTAEELITAITRVTRIDNASRIYLHFVRGDLAVKLPGSDRQVAAFLAEQLKASASVIKQERWVARRWARADRVPWIWRIRSWDFFRLTATCDSNEKQEYAQLFSQGKIDTEGIRADMDHDNEAQREISSLMRALERAIQSAKVGDPNKQQFTLNHIAESVFVRLNLEGIKFKNRRIR